MSKLKMVITSLGIFQFAPSKKIFPAQNLVIM